MKCSIEYKIIWQDLQDDSIKKWANGNNEFLLNNCTLLVFKSTKKNVIILLWSRNIMYTYIGTKNEKKMNLYL